MTQKKIDSAFVQSIIETKGHSPAFQYINQILPVVLFELMSLGQEALWILTARSAKLRLRDGCYYKIKFSHEHHAIVLYRMHGNTNAVLVTMFDNSSSQQDVYHALRPAIAAKAAA
jgi:hypothetical protein